MAAPRLKDTSGAGYDDQPRAKPSAFAMQPASVAIAALRKSAELGKDESLNRYRDNPAKPISVIAANEAMQFPLSSTVRRGGDSPNFRDH